ncbi:MAG: N-acetyltransferase [Gemmatimonadetes bacterium]|nr:MAG: N-acetyltransferase [Gemmatimonadota bacterium]
MDVPFRLEGNLRDPVWVPPFRLMVHEVLDTRRHPFYREADIALFLAEDRGRPLGRIAAIENRAHNRFAGDRTGFFGFFECVDDGDVASALVDAARGWLAERGLDALRGPVNPSTNYEAGLLVEGFDEHPVLQTPWNPPYYERLLRDAGLAPVKDLLGFKLTVDEVDRVPERVARLAERARERHGFTFRTLDMRNFQADVDICWRIYNEAWERNWGFVPMSREEFLFVAKEMRQVLYADLAFIAEVENEPAGFLLMVRDLNRVFHKIRSGRLTPLSIARLLIEGRRVDFGRLVALGIRPQFRRGGILPLFLHEVYRRGRAAGATGAEASWVLEDNEQMISPIQAMGMRAYRRWRLFEAPIVDGSGGHEPEEGP